MKVTLILTGKTKQPYLIDGEQEYYKRIKRYVPFNLLVIPDIKVSRKMNEEQVKKLEAQQQLQKVKSTDFLILLDEQGKGYSSQQFADFLEKLEGRTGQVVFMVGGPYGFDEEVYRRADTKMSLSKMTFSHQMVRMIFAEQLYRAYSILNGEPYHHK